MMHFLYYFHFGPELNLPVISYLKKNHMKHHFRDSSKGFGVINLFWDWVFGTMHVK
jgi:dihydroceramide fatty acyl 2-hydroxylase